MQRYSKARWAGLGQWAQWSTRHATLQVDEWDSRRRQDSPFPLQVVILNSLNLRSTRGCAAANVAEPKAQRPRIVPCARMMPPVYTAALYYRHA